MKLKLKKERKKDERKKGRKNSLSHCYTIEMDAAFAGILRVLLYHIVIITSKNSMIF
jgi:hypothetical protein